MAELSETQVEHDQFTRLRESGVIPIAELRKAELKLERLKREVALNRLQLEALQESLQRELKLAESTLEHAQAKLKLVELGFEKGIETSQHRLQAQLESDKARTAHEVSEASIRQLKKAMELVEKSNESDDYELSGEPTDDAVAR
jgi:outer membrane protein TolC